MKEKGNPLLQIIRNVNDAVVVVLFLAMTITVIIQVFFRFVIQSPLRWTEELARYLMICLVLMASAIAMRNRSHLQVDVLTSALPQKPKRILTAIVDLLTIVFLCIMTLYYDIFRVQSSTVYNGSDVSGDADSDGFDLRGIPNRWSFDDYGTAPYLYRTLKKQECTGRTERIYRLVKEAAIC